MQTPYPSKTNTGQGNAWQRCIALSSLWLPAGLLAIVLKALTLKLGNGEMIALRRLGRGGGALSLLEQLSLYQADLILALVVVPIFLVLLLRVVPARVRPFVSLCVSSSCALLLIVDIGAFLSIGQFLSWALISDAAHVAIHDLELAFAYVTPGKIVLFIATISSQAFLLWAALGGASTQLAALVKGVIVGACAVAGLGLAADLPMLPQHRSSLVVSLRSLVNPVHDAVSPEDRLRPEQVLAAFRDLSRTPPRQESEYWARERSSNLIIFALETTPKPCLPLPGDPDHTPAMATLREHALVSEHHHCTYPYTTKAVYSIVSSHYPSPLDPRAMETAPDAHTGLLWSLRRRGYDTILYTPPDGNLTKDRRFPTWLGFSQVCDVARAEDDAQAQRVENEISRCLSTLPPGIDDALRNSLRDRLIRNLPILEALKEDLGEHLAADHPFAFVFVPQIGHGPWPDFFAHGGDQAARCGELTRIQDSWLRQILDVIIEEGALERTVILVTGDHGVRSVVEDPSFERGRLSNYSFEVPLLLYAPGSFSGAPTVSWVSSHIDVTPTLNDLFGIAEGREFEQGLPLWDPRLAGRVTFFIADSYLGANAFHDNGQFAMASSVTDAVYLNDTFAFEAEDLLLPTTPDYSRVRDTLQRFSSLQRRWPLLASEHRSSETGEAPPR